MFRIVPINPSKPPGKKRGRPLHVSLSTSSHDHTDPTKAGIILTIGRTGCDVNFPDMDKVDNIGTLVGSDPSHQTVKISATVSGRPGKASPYTADYTLSLDKNLYDLTWAVSATTDGGRSYSRMVPYDCNLPGLDQQRIQRVPLSTPLGELTKSWPTRSKVRFRFLLDDKDDAAIIRRPRIGDEGPHQILRLVTTRPDLVGKSWPIRNRDGSDGIRRYMPARSKAERDACRAASDGIIVVVEQGDKCDPRIPLTRILNGKRIESNRKMSLRIVGYGTRLIDKRPFVVEIRETQTLWDLMTSIEARRKISPSLQCLTYKGRELSDVTARLVDCGLSGDATLILTRRPTPRPVSAPVAVSTRRSVKTSKRRHNLPGPGARMALTTLSLPSDDDIAETAQSAAPWASALPVASLGELDYVRLGSVRSDQSTDRLCSMVEIRRVPINLCPSKVDVSTRSKIENFGPLLGVTLADSAIGFNSTPFDALLGRTHLLVPSSTEKQNPTIKSLSAWCLNVPIVTTDFVLKGLANRKTSRDPLPDAKAYSPWKGGGSGIEYSQAIIAEEEGTGPCHGRRDPLKGFVFISLAPMEIEGLVLAAGANVFRAYLLHDALFCEIDWLDLKISEGWPREGDPMGGRIAVIDPMLDKFQPRLQFLDEYGFPRVLCHEIVASVNRMDGSICDVGGNLLRGMISVQPARFRLRWENRKISIDNLPPDALRLILQDYVGGSTEDMLTLLRLSSLSKGLQKCIFQDCPFLWTNIDFSTLDMKFRKRLRDKQLEALLRRTNAVEVTKYLNLKNCIGIRGSGLVPLRGSTTLLEIDLSFSGGTHTHKDPVLDADTICSVLESMPPFVGSFMPNNLGLRLLEMDYFGISRKIRISKERKASIDKLETLEKRFGSLLAHGSCCADCGTSIYERQKASFSSRTLEIYSEEELDAMIGEEGQYCFCPGCKDLVCGDDKEGCRDIKWCDDCGTRRCQDCTKMESCSSCEETYCCQPLLQCGGCNSFQCKVCARECDFVNTVTCFSCDATRCTECRTFDLCQSCKNQFCRGLHGTLACSGCGNIFCETCSDLEHCGACHNFFCRRCKGTNQCRDCDMRCCRECMAASCKSCEEHICPGCSNEEGPSFATTCQICEKSHCRLCVPVCAEEECSARVCRHCRFQRGSCQSCYKYFCADHQLHCPVGGCKATFCNDCVAISFDDETKNVLGDFCKYCSHSSLSLAFLCTSCSDDGKLGFCSECQDEFGCTNEKCAVGGRNQRWCKACEVRYCSECSSSHKEHCGAADDPYAEVVWFDHMNEEVNSRMKRFYKDEEKRPSNPYRRQAYSNPYMSDHNACFFKNKCSSEVFFSLPLQKKIAFAEQVYAEVRKRHKSEAILDIDSDRIQPRIDSKFKKKPKKRTGQH